MSTGLVLGAAQKGRRWHLLLMVAVGLFVVGPGCVVAQAASAKPSFSTDPALEPGFAFAQHDYVIRCATQPVTVDVSVPRRWEGKVGTGSFRSGVFSVHRSLTPGKAVTITFRRRGHEIDRFHARCLPSEFPEYAFNRTAPGGPKLFSIQPTGSRYTAIFNRDGVPVWWFDVGSPAFIAEVLPDGTFALGSTPNLNLQTGSFPIYSLTGKRLRVVKAAHGLAADLHELVLLPNGTTFSSPASRKSTWTRLHTGDHRPMTPWSEPRSNN